MHSSRRPTADLCVAVLIPAYNEKDTLPKLLAALDEVQVEGLQEVIVVDNGSTDSTVDVARAAGARVATEPRLGYGSACRGGIETLAAENREPDVLVFLDADDGLAPAQIHTLLAPIRDGRADMVVGERRALRRAGVRLHAALGNRLVLGVLHGLYGDRTRDMGPFRAIRWDCLMALSLDDPDFGWYVQMQVRALRAGYRVMGLPVAFQRREGGASKVSGSISGSVAAARGMLRALVRETCRRHPDHSPYSSLGRGPRERTIRARR
jgi:glycosyltransferase involved in cell wall biosynthesis